MGTSPSLLAIVFLLFGFLCFLCLPPLLAIGGQRYFASRFERLVRTGHILPIFRRPEDSEQENATTNGISGRIKVTLKSLVDVWIRPQAQETVVPEIDWKPIAASFRHRQESRTIADAILTNRKQRNEAIRNLQVFRARLQQSNNPVVNNVDGRALTTGPAGPKIGREEGISSKAVGNATPSGNDEVLEEGRLGICMMILMPSVSRRQYHGRNLGRDGSDIVRSKVASAINNDSLENRAEGSVFTQKYGPNTGVPSNIRISSEYSESSQMQERRMEFTENSSQFGNNRALSDTISTTITEDQASRKMPMFALGMSEWQFRALPGTFDGASWEEPELLSVEDTWDGGDGSPALPTRIQLTVVYAGGRPYVVQRRVRGDPLMGTQSIRVF